MDNIFLRCISSAKSISVHFFLLNHQGPLYRQTHNTFAVKRSLNKFQNKLISIFPLVMDKKIFPLWHLFCPMYSPDDPFLCLIGILHASALRKRKELQYFTKKIKRNKTSKFSLDFDTIWILQIIFFKMKILKILCRNSTISHLIIKVDPKYWSYMPVSTPENEF